MNKVHLISVARDVEGWIAPSVLTEAGFNIVETFWLDVPGLNCKRATQDTEDLPFLWHCIKHDYPVILCTHSVETAGVVVRGGKHPVFWPHDTFEGPNNRQNNRMLYLWTCFCDFQTRQPTPYINLPGFNHDNEPGYFAVTEYHQSCRYRRWLAIVKQHAERQPDKQSVAKWFAEIVTPRLQKYERTTRQKWLFFKIQFA